MQQKIGTLRLALTFAGCFLGAGYVSGQELWQYFGAFGARGLLGLALAVVLLGGTGVLLLRLSARTGIETMDALIVRADIPWLRTAVGVLTAALLFGVVCIMAAGIGALGNQMLGLPVWLGAAIACVLIAAAAYFGLGGMVSVFTVAVPCMIVAALVIAGIRLHRTELTAAAFAAGDTNPMLGSWATSAVNYAAYNFFATVGILAPLTRHLKKPAPPSGAPCSAACYCWRSHSACSPHWPRARRARGLRCPCSTSPAGWARPASCTPCCCFSACSARACPRSWPC